MNTEQPVPPSRHLSVFNILITFFLLIIIVNLALIDYWIIKQLRSPNPTPTPLPQTNTPTATQLPPLTCTDACLDIIKEATASLTKATPQATQTTSRPRQTTAPTTAPATPKEFFVTLGSGTTAAGDWSDLPDILVPVNTGNYSNVKAIYFEASLSVPESEGIAYARLYNATDGKPITDSDITTSNPSPQLLTSQPIQLEGTKTYKIQMKSSERKDVRLTNGRIKIVLN